MFEMVWRQCHDKMIRTKESLLFRAAKAFMDLENNMVSGICLKIIQGWVESGWDICEIRLTMGWELLKLGDSQEVSF